MSDPEALAQAIEAGDLSRLTETAAVLRALQRERDELTLLLRRASEAKNGTARDHDGAALNGFVLPHHDYMKMHCLLNVVSDKAHEPVEDAAHDRD